jgi:hypothetical protein
METPTAEFPAQLRRAALFALLIAFTGLGAPRLALCADDETVPISKERLQELLRKEAELNKMKGDLNKTKGDLQQTQGDLEKTKGQNQELKKQHEQDTAKIAAAPASPPEVTHLSPPISSLPVLKEGEIVDAMDLGNYYRADAATADQRFLKHSFQVQGEVAAIEKPLFIRNYKIVLKTADRDLKVVCNIYPPEKYRTTFIMDYGSKLIGELTDGTRVELASKGTTATISGECKGVQGTEIYLAGCELKSVKPK